MTSSDPSGRASARKILPPPEPLSESEASGGQGRSWFSPMGLQLDDASLQSLGDRLGPVVDLQLGEDVRNVGLHGAFANR